MLLKYFPINGGHDEPGGLTYLLKNPTARVVRGDPELTKWVIDHSPPGLRQRFLAGVINDLTKLDRRYDDLLLDELQIMLLAGRPKSSMVLCVIEHTDKDKRELHFVIVLFDLLFAKLIHPYIDRIDRHGFDAWVEHFSLRHDLEITSEKLRIRPPFEHLHIRRCEIVFLEEVWEKVHGWAQAGDVNCRHDLQTRLAQEGYQVRCHSRKGKPLQQPVIIGPDEKKLRLKNSIYYRPDYGSPRVQPIDRTDPRAVKTRLAELRQIIQNRMVFRAHHLIGRMFGVREKRLVAKGKARQRFQELIDQRLEADRHADRLWQRVNFGRVCREAIFHNHVVPAGSTHPKWMPSVGLGVVGQTDIELPATVDPVAQETPMPGDMAPADPVGKVPTSTPSNAEPETLRSPATGMNDVSETPSPPPAGSTPTGRRKIRPPTMEMEDPPLS